MPWPACAFPDRCMRVQCGAQPLNEQASGPVRIGIRAAAPGTQHAACQVLGTAHTTVGVTVTYQATMRDSEADGEEMG